MTRVAFLGLGKMGRGMAENVAAAGFPMWVYNRTAERCAPLVERGAVSCATPAAAAREAEVVVTMLADDRALLETALGEQGFAAAMTPGALHISMSTVSVGATERLAERHRADGVDFVAGPVYGRPDVAEAGELYIAAGGPPELEARCRPLFEAMGRDYLWLDSNPVVATAAKIANNSILLNAIEAIAEAFTVIEKVGGDRARYFEIARMLLAGPSFEAYARRMVDQAFQPAGFATDLALKDAGLMVDLARGAHSPAPQSGVTHDRLLQAVARGRAGWDLAALIEVARENAGLA